MNAERSTAALSSLLVRLWRHLSRHRQHQFVFIMFLMLLSALAEVVSLGALLPFLGILTAPEAVFNYRVVAHLAHAVGITTAQQLLLPLTIAFAVIALLAGAIRLLLLGVSTRFTFATGADLSIEVYRRTLYQPYHVHVARNSSEVISGITKKVLERSTCSACAGADDALRSDAAGRNPVALFAVDPLVALVGHRRVRWRLRPHHGVAAPPPPPQQACASPTSRRTGRRRCRKASGASATCCSTARSRCTAISTVSADRRCAARRATTSSLTQSPRYLMEPSAWC